MLSHQQVTNLNDIVALRLKEWESLTKEAFDANEWSKLTTRFAPYFVVRKLLDRQIGIKTNMLQLSGAFRNNISERDSTERFDEYMKKMNVCRNDLQVVEEKLETFSYLLN